MAPQADFQPGPDKAIPWLVLDAAGRVVAAVHAADALAAARQAPPGTSIYVGGPSARHPRRPWWTDSWPRERLGESGQRIAASA